MSVLEIVAEKHLGSRTLRRHPQLRVALQRMEHSATLDAEKQRIAAIIELCFEFGRETDPEEKKNILRTLEELSANEPVVLPTESVEAWDERLKRSNPAYAKAGGVAEKKTAAFLANYFALRSRAGLATQTDVARQAGLSRSYVAVIESGKHVPQQKTLQKLAKAFGVEITELLR